MQDLESLPLCQADCLSNLFSMVKQLGAAPEGARCQGALQALRTAGSSYEGPDPGVGDVVAMDLGRLSLPSGKVAGVSMHSQLTGDVKDIVCHFEETMLQDSSVWTDLQADAAKLTPYDDPLLKTREGYLNFLHHLHQSGVLSFTSVVRGEVGWGAFCVAKKPKIIEGVKVERQRLVLDCRAVNLLFREPPRTRLGSLPSVSEAYLPPEHQLFVATADICDCFYTCDCPPGLEQFFCLQSDVSADEALWISDGGFNVEDWEGIRIAPCIKVLPMGFNWSFYLVQLLHEQASLDALGITEQQLFLDGSPAPKLDAESCATMPYCDNVHVLSCSSKLCQEGKDKVCGRLEEMGFVLHEHTSASTITRTLGGIIDGDIGHVRCTPQRIWSLILAFEYLVDHKVSVELVQRLLGHAMVACVINRSGMSVFRYLYDFVHSGAKPRKLNVKERMECNIFIGILPLLVSDIRRPWSSTISCTDASPAGWGIVERQIGDSVVQSIGKWQERWRFRRLDPSEWKPRGRALGLDPFRDIRTVVGTKSDLDDLDNYVANNDFPEVPHCILNPSHWKTVSMGKWKHSNEHITLKEARALHMAVRRLSRASHHRNHRHLVFVDNMALCFSANKGRASNFGILRVLQQIGSICLAASITLRTRWVASEANCADGPSRGQITPGPFSSQCSPQASEESKCPSGGANVPSWQKEGGEAAESWRSENKQWLSKESAQESVSEQGQSASQTSSRTSFSAPAEETQAAERAFETGRRAHVKARRDEHQCGSAESVRPVLQQVRGLLQGERNVHANHSHRHRCSALRVPGLPVLRRQVPSRGRENYGCHRVPPALHEGKPFPLEESSQGMEKGGSPTEPSFFAQDHDVWHSYGAGGSLISRDGPLGSYSLSSVPPPGRGDRFEEAQCGLARQEGRGAVQVDDGGHQRCGGYEARQSGRLRQQLTNRPAQVQMVGRRAGQAGQKAARSGQPPLHLQHGGVQESVCSSRQKIGSGGTAPIPATAWGGYGRPHQQKSGLSGSQGQGPLDDGPIGPAIHQGGASPTAPQQADSRQAELLLMGRKKPSPSPVGSESCEVFGQQMTFPDIFTMTDRPRRFCLEIFAGTARVSQCLQQKGISAFPIDTCLFPSHNVLDPSIARGIFNFIRQGRVLLIWLGMPCTTFSRARKHDGLGPGPLRDSQHVWGLPYLSFKDFCKLREGNQLFHFTLKLLQLCEEHKVPFVLENPLTSYVWDLPPLFSFKQHTGALYCDLDFCMYGEVWKKPTRLLYKGIDLTSLHIKCNGIYNICSRSNRPHFALSGRDAAGVFWTLRAQPYPWSLASKFASLVARAL